MPLVNYGYLRHRNRMVAKSVTDDLRETLTTTDDWVGWLPREGVPNDPVLALVKNQPIAVTEYFPDHGSTAGMSVPLNTLAVDAGTALNPQEHELGGLLSQVYVFNMAIHAADDATGLALFKDLEDRYANITAPRFITLWDYLASPREEFAKLEVESFEFAKPVDQPNPKDASYFEAQLLLTDYLAPRQF